MVKQCFARPPIGLVSPALLGVLAAGALASPASAAWTPACLWNGIPAADRAAIVAGAPQEQGSGLAPADIKAAVEACGVAKAETADAQKAFSAYGRGLAAMAALERRNGTTQAQVLDAWAALPTGDRAAVVAIARTMRNEPQKVAILNGVVAQLGQRLNLVVETAPELKQIAYSLALLQSLGRGGIAQ
jgi:hypothetical protein